GGQKKRKFLVEIVAAGVVLLRRENYYTIRSVSSKVRNDTCSATARGRRLRGLVGRTRLFDEPAHLVRVFLSRAGFDAAGDIHAIRPPGAAGAGDVLRRQPAGEDQRHADVETGQQVPRRRRARATEQARTMAVHQNRAGHAPGAGTALDIATDHVQTAGV